MRSTAEKIRAYIPYFMVFYILNKNLFDWASFGASKLLYYSLVFIGAVFGAVAVYKSRKYRAIVISFAVYCVCVFLNGLFLSNFSQFLHGIKSYITFFLPLFAFLFYLKGDKNYTKLIKGIVLWGAITGILACYEYLAGKPVIASIGGRVYLFQSGDSAYRATVFIGSPMLLAMALGTALVFSCYYMHRKKNWFYLICTVLIFAGILATSSRAPLVFALLGVAVMYLQFMLQGTLSRKFVLIVSGIAAGGALILALFVIFPELSTGIEAIDFLIYRFSSTLDFKNEWGNVARLKIWSYYIGQFLKCPLFGYGIATTSALVAGNQWIDFGEFKQIVTESGLLGRLVETGLVGTVAYYWFLFTCFRAGLAKVLSKFRKCRKNSSLFSLMGVFVLIMAEDMILQVSFDIYTVFLICFTLTYAIHVRQTEDKTFMKIDIEDLYMSIKELLLAALGTVKRIPMLLAQFFPRSKDIYIFGAWKGQKFSDNSRALFLYALEHANKTCIWICKNKQVCQQLTDAGYEVYMANSLKGIWYQLRAGAAFSCVGDCDFTRNLLGGCMHIELWHGVGGCKKIGMDDAEYRKNAMRPRCRFYSKLEKRPLRKHYFIYTSEETKKVFKTAFLVPDDHFIHGGQPRNDMFYDPEYRPQTISHDEFGGKKVIVYMPTHRKTGQVCMDMSKLLDLPALNDFCEKHNAVFLIKKHFYHGAEKEDLSAFPNIMDITNRPVDSNELMLATDYLISDYSSCTGDYVLLDRPMFFYCFDYQDYVSLDRDMYWPYDSVTPGPHCTDFSQLLDELRRSMRGIDHCRTERERVRNMYYDATCQKACSGMILEQVEKLLKK